MQFQNTLRLFLWIFIAWFFFSKQVFFIYKFKMRRGHDSSRKFATGSWFFLMNLGQGHDFLWWIWDRVMIFLTNLRQGHDFFWWICDGVMIFLKNLRGGHDFFWWICDGVMIFSDEFAAGSWIFLMNLDRVMIFLTNLRQGHDFFWWIWDRVMIFLTNLRQGHVFFGPNLRRGYDYFFNGWKINPIEPVSCQKFLNVVCKIRNPLKPSTQRGYSKFFEIFRYFFLFKDFQETLIINILIYLLLFNIFPLHSSVLNFIPNIVFLSFRHRVLS